MYDLYDLDIKFLFWDGGLGGDALVRAITCRLPLSNNYDTSYCNKATNKHSGSDVFCGVLSCKKISNILATKLKKIISEVSWKMSEELAETRGTFVNWDKSDFAKVDKKVRNVNCTIIAPTGSIGTIANCSPGIAVSYTHLRAHET